MSLIKENFYLESELIRIAQGKPQPDQYLNTIVLQGLMSKLESNLASAETAAVNQFTSGRNNTEVFLQDLSSSDSLLNFFDRNKVSYQGAPLVFGHISSGFSAGTSAGDIGYQQLSSDLKRQYFKYPNPTDPNKNDFTYYVNKNGIISFLKLQLDQAKQSGNELQTTLANKLMQQISALSGQNLFPPDSKKDEQTKPSDKSTTTTQEQDKSKNVVTPGQLTDAQQVAQVKLIVGLLPLRTDTMDFTAIKMFMDKIQTLMPEVSSYASQIDQYINGANSLSKNQNFIPINENAAQSIKNSMIDQQQATFCKYISYVMYILENVTDVILKFKRKFGDELSASLDKDGNLPILNRPQNKSWYQAVLTQVGGHENDAYGISNRNMVVLRRMQQAAGCFKP